MKKAEYVLQQLNSSLESVDNLPTEEADRLAAMIREVCGHALRNDPIEPPLGLEWPLSHVDIYDMIHSRITGVAIDAMD